MAQMTESDRCEIEFLLKSGITSMTEIGRRLGRPKQTIAREIKNRRIDSNKGAKENNALCVHFKDCTRKNVCDTGCGERKQCKRCHQCFLQCRDFQPRTCDRLFLAPFVCNGCISERVCHLPKKYYIAEVAQGDRHSKLHDSRSHIQTSDEQCARMNEVLKNGLANKQSLNHIRTANADAFEGVTERTLYRYIGAGCFDVGRGDLPSACSRKPRHKQYQTKTKAKCRSGRTHDNFILWKKENPDALVPEVDTLKGRIGGKVIFTIQFPCQFMLAFIKERETAQTWTGIVNSLYRIAGPHLFSKLFPAILTDNGAPFLDPEMTENARDNVNTHKLIPRTKVFYCDPYCATQKPHVERNHIEVRRVLIKGTSFDSLTQEDIDKLMSHINSSIRPSIDNTTPYDAFIKTYGKEAKAFLDRVGISRIDANEVKLCPCLLGERFRRHADRTLLKQNGIVRPTPKQTDKAEK